MTVAQILATAAVVDGKAVRTLDQTGLAQKGGAVVSDVKITERPVAQAPKLAAGECDLYLACDALVATDPAHLAATDPGRTVAVVSTSEVPTGRMIVDPAVSFPQPSAISSALDAATARASYLDARGMAETLFGDDQFANLLQLGAAYQSGALGVSARAIETAIELNGAAVETNLQAFRRGRQLAADPDALAAELAAPASGDGEVPGADVAAVRSVRALVRAEQGSELARLLDVRIPELIAYQNERYARDYAETVEHVRARLGGGAVTEAVARNLYKLMAYKDEYEVARLSLDPRLTADLEARFGAGSRYAFHLHPPVLRALGLRRKLRLGRGVRPVLRLLRAARVLRGTRLDVFGYARVRRAERELIAEYRDAVLRGIEALPADDPALVELAELPDLVRGYEDIKLDAVAAYRRRQAELLPAAESAAAGAGRFGA